MTTEVNIYNNFGYITREKNMNSVMSAILLLPIKNLRQNVAITLYRNVVRMCVREPNWEEKGRTSRVFWRW